MSINQKAILNAIKDSKEETKKRKFVQSIELIVNLKDVNMKSAEGKIQERIELPHQSPEKTNKICVIATGELALKANRAKADRILEKDELQNLAGKKKELRKIANLYDFFIAEAPLMPNVGKIMGISLGPRGKMPIPVPPNVDIKELIERYRKIILIRTRNQPIIQCRVGTENMKDEEIAENVQTVIRVLERKLSRGAKNIKSVYIKRSMTAPVKVTR